MKIFFLKYTYSLKRDIKLFVSIIIGIKILLIAKPNYSGQFAAISLI